MISILGSEWRRHQWRDLEQKKTGKTVPTRIHPDIHGQREKGAESGPFS